MAAIGFAGCAMPSYDRALWGRCVHGSTPGIPPVAVSQLFSRTAERRTA